MSQRVAPLLGAILASSLMAVVVPMAAHADAPAPPTALTVGPAAVTQASSVSVSWTRAAPDVTSDHWALCGEDGTCTTGTTPDSQTTIPTPTEGRFTVRVWSENAAGEEDENAAATAEVIVDRTAPSMPSDVRWSSSGEITWGDPTPQNAPISRVHWVTCGWGTGGVGGPCAEGTSGGRPVVVGFPPLPDVPCPTSLFGPRAAVWLEDAAGNVDRAQAGFSPIGTLSRACAATPPAQPPKTTTTLRITGKTTTLKSGARRVRVTLVAPRAATGSVSLQMTTRRGGSTLGSSQRSVRLRTGHATATWTVPRRATRLVIRASFAGDDVHRSAHRTWSQKFRAR
jgi:hypothetical protein